MSASSFSKDGPPPLMFRISKQQINAGSPQQLQIYDARLIALLEQKYPPRDEVARKTLHDHVAPARAYAQSLGFDAEQHVLDLVEASFVTGNAIWRDPFFERVVAAPLRTREQKCVSIRRRYIAPDPTQKVPEWQS